VLQLDDLSELVRLAAGHQVVQSYHALQEQVLR
jgi:hypothetical protein